MQNTYYFLGANPTVDLVIINPLNQILLIKRSPNTNACPNMLALPGGFIDTSASKHDKWLPGTETPEHAAIREVLEETNLQLINPTLSFIGIFEGNHRDPRDNDISWSKSFAFLHVIPDTVFQEQKNNLRGMDDAVDVSWHNINDIHNLTLAFDHNIIINKAISIYLSTTSKMKP